MSSPTPCTHPQCRSLGTDWRADDRPHPAARALEPLAGTFRFAHQSVAAASSARDVCASCMIARQATGCHGFGCTHRIMRRSAAEAVGNSAVSFLAAASRSRRTRTARESGRARFAAGASVDSASRFDDMMFTLV